MCNIGTWMELLNFKSCRCFQLCQVKFSNSNDAARGICNLSLRSHRTFCWLSDLFSDHERLMAGKACQAVTDCTSVPCGSSYGPIQRLWVSRMHS